MVSVKKLILLTCFGLLTAQNMSSMGMLSYMTRNASSAVRTITSTFAGFGRNQIASVKSLFNNQSRTFANMVWPEQSKNTVRIYHTVNPLNDSSLAPSLENVKRYGLLSGNELFKRGYIKSDPSKESWIFPGHYDRIYFRHSPKPRLCDHRDLDFCPDLFYPGLYHDSVVGIDVDPYSTYVYNSEFRRGGTLHEYNKSKILFSKYINNIKKYHEMNKKVSPGKMIVFDPFTSEPFEMDKEVFKRSECSDEYQFPSRLYLYLNEITIPGRCIEPKHLVFPKKF